MPSSLQEELKQFEKELSMLLVRFMKICDQVEASKVPPSMEPPKSAAVVAPSPPAKKPETSFVAYA